MATTYHINWDALLARVVYRWHWRIALGALLIGVIGSLLTGLVPPIWRGTAMMSVSAPAGAVVEVDGRPWPHALYAGRHVISAALPGGRVSWTERTLLAGETVTVTLPAGLPSPLVQPLPPPAPGARVRRVEWVNGAWRAVSIAEPDTTDAEPPADTASATPTPAASHTVAFSARGTERLSTIDAYGGLADQLRLDGRQLEAVYRPNERGFGADAAGAVEVRGWRSALVTVPLSSELTLVRFSPDAATLLLAERTPGGGEQVSVADRDGARTAVVAVPGRVVRTAWREDGAALVLHSQSGDQLSLTLIRLRPTVAAATIAEMNVHRAAGIVPLTWSRDGVFWVGPDADGVPSLWHAPLHTLIPDIRGRLDARAIDYSDDGSLRVLWVDAGRLAIGWYRDTVLTGEAFVPQLDPSEDLAGIWHGDELLVQDEDGAWLVTLPE